LDIEERNKKNYQNVMSGVDDSFSLLEFLCLNNILNRKTDNISIIKDLNKKFPEKISNNWKFAKQYIIKYREIEIYSKYSKDINADYEEEKSDLMKLFSVHNRLPETEKISARQWSLIDFMENSFFYAKAAF
jgi:hypothetical protein